MAIQIDLLDDDVGVDERLDRPQLQPPQLAHQRQIGALESGIDELANNTVASTCGSSTNLASL